MKPAAITMGCPVGVGPEIILRFFDSLSEAEVPAAPVVLGDLGVLRRTAAMVEQRNPVDHLGAGGQGAGSRALY